MNDLVLDYKEYLKYEKDSDSGNLMGMFSFIEEKIKDKYGDLFYGVIELGWMDKYSKKMHPLYIIGGNIRNREIYYKTMYDEGRISEEELILEMI